MATRWIVANSEKQRAYNLKYSRSAKGKATAANWRARTPHRFHAEPEANRLRYRSYYAANRDQCCASKRARKKTLADLERQRIARRKWKMLNSKRVLVRTPNWVSRPELAAIYERCPEGMEVDHIVPLKGRTIDGNTVSGLNVPWNLQYLTAIENRQKHSRMRPEDHAICGG